MNPDLFLGKVSFNLSHATATGKKTVTYTITPAGGSESSDKTLEVEFKAGAGGNVAKFELKNQDLSKNFTITIKDIKDVK